MLVCKDKNTGKLRYAENGITPEIMHERLTQMGVSLSDVEMIEITEQEWADLNGPWNQPSDAELEARAEATRQALFAENDKPLMMYMRRLFAGDETARAGFEACNAYAEALRAMNDTPDWYRNPQWPTKPEV